jgi:hypothetical protein
VVRARALSAALAAAALVLAAMLPGCLGDEELGPAEIACPSLDGFRVVSQVLERRCGTVDCHGDGARPFRIYGRTGLRRPETRESYGPGGGAFDEYVTGGTEPTSDAEVADNRLAACGVEPEIMAAVVAGDASIDALTLVRKPRLVEAHKGGLVWAEGTQGDKCLTSWIQGSVDALSCNGELKRP